MQGTEKSRQRIIVLLTVISFIQHCSDIKLILNKTMALQPRRAKTDWSSCCQMEVQGALWLAKRLSLYLNFSFLNRISLLLISSTYPIVLMRLGGPRSRPYTPRNISRIYPGIEPGTSWMAVRRANHHTKQAVDIKINFSYNIGVQINNKKNYWSFGLGATLGDEQKIKNYRLV